MPILFILPCFYRILSKTSFFIFILNLIYLIFTIIRHFFIKLVDCWLFQTFYIFYFYLFLLIVPSIKKYLIVTTCRWTKFRLLLTIPCPNNFWWPWLAAVCILVGVPGVGNNIKFNFNSLWTSNNLLMLYSLWTFRFRSHASVSVFRFFVFWHIWMPPNCHCRCSVKTFVINWGYWSIMMQFV
jgi:hypothetical protein